MVGNFNLIDPDGSPALDAPTDPIPGGSIIVSQLKACLEIAPGLRVSLGTVCDINSTFQGILLAPGDDAALIAAAQTPNPIENLNPDGEDDTSLNVFAEMVLRKDWSENLRTALRYTRTQGGASGLGGAVIRDTVNLSNTWEITEKWQLATRADWRVGGSERRGRLSDPAVPGR